MIVNSKQVAYIFQTGINRWYLNGPVLDWETAITRVPVEYFGLEGLLEQLVLINCFQWHLEDRCRENYDNLEEIGKLKLLIDLSNHRRTIMINMINDKVCEILLGSRGKDDSVVVLETPGSAYDRLSILFLKYNNSENDPFLNKQIHDLMEAIDRLTNDIYSGKQIMGSYSIKKMYGKEKA